MWTLQEVVARLSTAMSVDHREWQVGVTKVFMRRGLAASLGKIMGRLRNNAAKRMQRLLTLRRRYHARRAINHALHGLWTRRQYRKLRRATVIAQCLLRLKRTRRAIAVATRVRGKFEKLARGLLHRQALALIRRPYWRKTADDLLWMLVDLEERAAKGEPSQELERQRVEVLAALEETALMEAEGPDHANGHDPPITSRSELESRITDLEARIEALKREADYDGCAALAKEVKALVSMRPGLPTAGEVSEQLSALEAQKADHFKASDFRACEATDRQIKFLRIKHRHVLVTATATATAEALPPAPESAPAPAPAPTADGDTAGTAGADDESAATGGFTSRWALEEAITAAEAELASLQSQKRYGDCQAVQDRLDTLTALRPSLPTLADADAEIAEIAQKLAEAEAARRYGDCQALQDQLQIATSKREALAKELADRAPKLSRGEMERKKRELTDRIAQHSAAREYALCQALQQELAVLTEATAGLPSLQELEAQVNDKTPPPRPATRVSRRRTNPRLTGCVVVRDATAGGRARGPSGFRAAGAAVPGMRRAIRAAGPPPGRRGRPPRRTPSPRAPGYQARRGPHLRGGAE
jgi:hypothetical protein